MPQFMTEIPQTPLKEESVNLFKRITGNMRRKEESEAVGEYGIVNPKTFSVKVLTQVSSQDSKIFQNEYELRPLTVKSIQSLNSLDPVENIHRISTERSQTDMKAFYSPIKTKSRPVTATSPRINNLKKSIQQIGSAKQFS